MFTPFLSSDVSIPQFAYAFAKDYVDCPKPLSSSKNQVSCEQPPIFRQFNSMPNEFAFIARCIKQWVQVEGEKLNQIGLIYPNSWSAQNISKTLRVADIPHQFVDSLDTFQCPKIREEQVLLLPREFNGTLQFSRVIIAGLGRLNSDQKHFTEEIALLYNIMRCAKTHLVVTTSSDNKFTSRVESIL